MDFSALMQAHANALEAKLLGMRSALKHAGQKGTAAETAVMTMLREVLPDRLGLTEGIVVSSSGYVSPQQDIIIYDLASAPVFFRAGSTKAIPIEYVYAVIEVKTSLTAADVKQFSERNLGLRSQQKFFVGDTDPKTPREGRWTYHQAGRKWFSPPINAFMFAFECQSLNSVWQAYQDCYAPSSNFGNWIDSICIGQVAFLSRITDKNGLGDTIERPKILACIDEKPLLAFLGQLWLLSVEWQIRERPAMFRYVKNYSFGIAQQAPFRGAVDHPDCMTE